MLLLYGNDGIGLVGVADVTHVVGVGDCDRGGGGGGGGGGVIPCCGWVRCQCAG